jgi:ABC-type dipeptide/oligopeptide/nickel transport system ATPase component
VPLAIGLFALRRADLRLLAGVSLGVSAGTTGAMVGELACGRDATHVLLFHVTAWVAVVAAGALLSRVVRPRSYAP